MTKPRISGRIASENLFCECFTKGTIELQLTYCLVFLSLTVKNLNAHRAPISRRKRSYKKDKSRPWIEAAFQERRTNRLRIKNSSRGFYSTKYGI